MITFVNEIVIALPRHQVFGYLANLENVPAWNYAIKRTQKVSSGPIGVGTEFRQIRTLPRPSEEVFAVTEFEPPERLVIEGSLGPFNARMIYRLEGSGNTTTLVNEVQLTPHGAARLVAPVASRTIKSAVADNLAVLKKILEAG